MRPVPALATLPSALERRKVGFQRPASGIFRLSLRRNAPDGGSTKEEAMAEDWVGDVKKYASNADEKAIAGIVRYCGIALQKSDSSLVSFTDKKEVERVRVNFLRKKLGLPNPDAELDQAITAVADKMKGDRTKNRVTVYYLLAEHFGKLSVFT
jgi:hypothetical protein